MTLDQIPLLSMLKGKLGYLNERQKLISQNVANADTPGFTPVDLKPFTVEAAKAVPAAGQGAVSTVRTNSAHLAGTAAPVRTWKTVTAADSESRLDGNQVVLEDQMMKMTEARLDYDAAIGLYQKSLAMLRTAVRKPGG